ncbi:Glycosyl transferase family 2 [Algoriphagus faecimaris]|uniref:Glycosyl transferase family 2 n=1 Tax=Algoriphagus faecimaris TaxID=686796 RepID=A0A1G6PRS6_9BACT|nr:glycosyltransferase family A protein [Algoriphagus faecimaris]SDC82789.1 Glycosyl transferase family 2 [Algoriphagus faecimaris]
MIISIVIPYYKDFERLLGLLESLERQSLEKENWEVIVVNNDPELPLVLPNDFSVSYPLQILEEKKPGSYAARNKGIEESKGQIFAFTDSDCIPDKDWLKNAQELFLQDFKKEIGVLTGPVPLIFKNPNRLTDAEVYEKYTGFTTEIYAKEGHAITANWFSYKSVLEEFGCFNEELKSNGDSELSGKISQKYTIVYKENILVLHPARQQTSDLVNKYQRLLGGTYTRRFKGKKAAFLSFFLDFILRRYRFALKKLFTISPKESIAILRVCHAINRGAVQEYYNLIKGGETKR